MDIFDVADYDFLVSRRIRKVAIAVLAIGIAFLPPVKSWYVDQIQHHAEHLNDEFVRLLVPGIQQPAPE